ncbi:MAG: hypothetical protein R3F60_02175 [bacterium]
MLLAAPAHGEEPLEARKARVSSAVKASTAALGRGDCATASRALRTALDVPGPELEPYRADAVPLLASTVQCYLNAGRRSEACGLADELRAERACQGAGASSGLVPLVEGFDAICKASPPGRRASTWPWVGVAGGSVLAAGGVTLALGALVDSPPTVTDAQARPPMRWSGAAI